MIPVVSRKLIQEAIRGKERCNDELRKRASSILERQESDKYIAANIRDIEDLKAMLDTDRAIEGLGLSDR